jgi:hypothetical protein
MNSANSNPGEHQVAVQQAPLYGAVSYEGANCSQAKQDMVNEALRWGRIASNSDAFAGCIAASVNGAGALGVSAYRQCIGDPAYGASAATQISMAVAAARTPNDLVMSCEGVPPPGKTYVAHADIGTYGHTDPERLEFNRDWLTSNADNLGSPLCNSVAEGTPCRWAAYPWPNQDIADRIWHEVSHTHGYTHGADDRENAIVSCGYAGDPSWDYQRNTMPYIIGQCISAVLNHSNDVCGDPARGCRPTALHMIDAVDSTKCTCVEDPSPDPNAAQADSNYAYFSLQTGTALHETGDTFQFALASNGDLFAISKSGTGSGTTEVHVLSAASGYQEFSLHTATALHETGPEFDFALTADRDLVAIAKSGTGSGTTEVHILSAASNYSEFSLHTATALHETGDTFEFELAGNGDLFAISKSGTGTGTTEVHVLSAASGYQEFSLHTGTALHETGANFKFLLADNGDLFAISKSATGTGSTEVHVLSAASNYSTFSLHTGTALHETGASFDFLLAANRDLYAISKSSTGTGTTELHVLAH